MAQKQTEEKRRHLIETRGYPMGYHSKDEYDRFLKKNTRQEKRCIECGVEFEGIEKDECCSSECKKERRKKKTVKTNFERYGGPAPLCSEAVKSKAKSTCFERYRLQ